MIFLWLDFPIKIVDNNEVHTFFNTPFLNRFTTYDKLFIVLLIYSLLLRINYLSPPYLNGDSQRDYLVAHHIVSYNEQPQLGPWNGTFGVISSPLYYYLLSLFLMIRDNIIVLQLTNVILQVINLGIIYLFAKKLFSPSTALIASILFIFSYTVLNQTIDFWQPAIMLPFFSLSCLLVLHSYLKRSYLILLLSTATFIFSGTVHNSVFSLLPIFIISALLILRVLRRKVKAIWYYLGFCLVFLDTLLILHFPVVIYAVEKRMSISSLFGKNLSLSSNELFIGIIDNLRRFLDLFFNNGSREILSLPNLIFFAITITILIYFFFQKIDKERRVYTIIILLSISLPIVELSLMNKYPEKRYFTPVFVLLPIFIAQCINSTFTKFLLLKVFKVTLIALIIYIFSFDISNFYIVAGGRERIDSVKPLALKLKEQAITIKEKEMRDNISFFQIRYYIEGSSFREFSHEVWNVLESEFNTKFTKYDGYRTAPTDIISTNTDDYIFVICNTENILDGRIETCINKFFLEYSDYTLENEVYTANDYIKIYLVKKKSIY